MNSLQELGAAVAERRKALKYRQGVVAEQAGLTQETLSRFEQGRTMEFGTRKLLAVLAVLGLDLQLSEKGSSGSLDELRKERAQ
jgi:transcriptional regulator with XRE-family HTH domain